MVSNRKPTEKEKILIQFLIEKGSLKINDQWKQLLVVVPMEDGNMGSLSLYPDGGEEKTSTRNFMLSDVQFKDRDGIDVIATLYVDENDNLSELDIWKTDSSSLIDLPERFSKD